LPGFLFYASRFLPVTFGELIKALIPSAVCAAGTVSVMYGLRQMVQIDSPIAGIAVFLFVATAVYLMLCVLIRPTRKELLEIFNLLKLLTSRKPIIK
jgi:PST family polysaccharide transporter